MQRDRQQPMHLAPRCGARTRSGRPCRAPAMANGRCRMHGGAASGPPRGNANARVHGRHGAEAAAARARVRGLLVRARALIDSI